MKLSFRNPLVALGLAGTIVAGVVGAAGVALAQETPTPESQVTPAEDGALRPWAKLAGMAAIIKASELDRQVFIDGFAEGKTVAEVLVDNGLDPDTIKAEILANVSDGLDSLMDSTPDLSDRPHRPGRHFPMLVGAVESLAELLGLTEDEVKEALRSGDTVAEIAGANGVDSQSVIDGLVADAQAKLAEAVTNGRLTQEQADEIAANLKERITTFVNEGRPIGPRGERRMGAGLPGMDSGAFVPGA